MDDFMEIEGFDLERLEWASEGGNFYRSEIYYDGINYEIYASREVTRLGYKYEIVEVNLLNCLEH